MSAGYRPGEYSTDLHPETWSTSKEPIGKDQSNIGSWSNRISSSQVAYDEFGNQTAWGTQSWEYDSFDQVRNSASKAYLYTADDERVWVLDATDGGGAGLVEHFYLRDLDGKLLREYRVGLPALPPNASASIFADRFETADVSCWSAVDNEAGPIATDLDGPAAGCGGRGWTIVDEHPVLRPER